MTYENNMAIPASRIKLAINRYARHFVCAIFTIFLISPSLVRAQQLAAMDFEFNRIPSQFKGYAIVLGQRLQTSGKERITASGSLNYNPESSKNEFPVEIIWQYPLKIRLTQNGSSVSFDRFNPEQKIPQSKELIKTIQLLLEDSVEGFFSIRSTIGSTRHLGSGYKLPKTVAGSPGIDLVQVTYADVFQKGQPIVKTYWFNSETKLLGLVGYSSASGTRVDIVIDDWKDVEGEKIPFLIERWEDSKLTMRLKFSSATITAGTEDGTFGGN